LRAFLPAGTSVVDAGGGDDTTVPGEVSWNLGSVGVGIALHREVVITAPASLDVDFNTDILKARAQLTFTGGAEVDVIAEHAVTIHNPVATQAAIPELLLEVSTVQSTATVGNVLSYSLTLTNMSQQSINNIWVMYRVPEGTSFHGVNDAQPDILTNSCEGNNLCNPEDEAWWNFTSIPASGAVGNPVTINLNVLVETGSDGALLSAPVIATVDELADTISIIHSVPVVVP
jgi:uncharacterized repeat protein (TIGR01451 family)